MHSTSLARARFFDSIKKPSVDFSLKLRLFFYVSPGIKY